MQAPSSSRKFRALQQATNRPLDEVAREYAATPLTYEQIAAEWTVKVRRVFPELNLSYTLKDVFRLFEEHRVRRMKDRAAA